ncbi:Catenin alpha-2 [Nucella lapillus]
MSSSGAVLKMKWDPKNLEIRTKSVEKTLEPLVTQVTTLVNQNGPSNKKKGRSKKAHVLSAAVQKATENFVIQGEQIAEENPEVREDMMAAIEEVKTTGEMMNDASMEFAADPCSSVKRGAMVRAARALLSAVTRLLILADMVDVFMLLNKGHSVEDDLQGVMNATSQQGLMDSFKTLGKSIGELEEMAAKRQADLKDPRRRDELAAARAMLKKNTMMLLTTSKAYVRHPELAAAKANRDYAYKQLCEAINIISAAVQAAGASDAHPYEGPGELASALDELDQKIIMDPLAYNEIRSRPSLEERLESIISGAALMADSSCTRDDRRERIVQECNAVRQALQDLLSEYEKNAGRREPSENLEKAIDNMNKKTRDLRRQLRKAVVDHVSDTFLETNVPLLVLIEAAKAGDERGVEEYAQVFTEHANKLVEVANLACSMSSNEDGVKLVRMAAAEIDALCPQVVNAARVLAARPRSKAAQENMEIFKEAWEKQVRLLTDSVDDITTIHDFLAVSENHILEDVNKCVIALQENDADTLDRTAGAIRGRSARVCNVVTAEMDNYEPGRYTERVMEAVTMLRDQIMPNFAEKVEVAVDALNCSPPQDVVENEFIEASRLVYDGVRDIRQAVLLNGIDVGDSDSEVEVEDEYEAYTSVADADEYGKSDRAMMRQLPEEEKEKIQAQVEMFRMEKEKLDMEVAKWDDSGNDIIVMAKQMCMIMMEMTDFTRGRGPLKSTMDVINAAKKISEVGSDLDKLANNIADECPDSQSKDLEAYLQRIALYHTTPHHTPHHTTPHHTTHLTTPPHTTPHHTTPHHTSFCPDSQSKKDLVAYLQRIALYCHQLNITSKVKADVQSVSGELIVSGLDSATSLIHSAKNLMNAVVLTVKACYVASTKYKKGNAKKPVVLWKMKAPAKKPLVRREDQNELNAKVRRGAMRAHIEPLKALSEFQEITADSFC